MYGGRNPPNRLITYSTGPSLSTARGFPRLQGRMEAHSYNIRTPENDSRINVCELSQRGARRLKFRFPGEAPGINPDRAVAPRGRSLLY